MADILNIAAGSGNLLSLQACIYADNAAGYSDCGCSINIDGGGGKDSYVNRIALYGNVHWALGGIRFNTSVQVRVRAEASKDVRYTLFYTED